MKVASCRWSELALVVLTLFAGGVYGLYLPQAVRGGVIYSDEREYTLLAINLLTGHGYSLAEHPPYEPTALRVPGYPFFLAAIFSQAGPSETAVRLAQVGLYAGAVWLTVLIGTRVGGFRVGWLAGVLLNFYPFIGYFAGLLLSETLAVLLFLGAAYAFLRAAEDGYWRWFLGGGIFGGLVTLVRPQFFPLPFFLAIGATLARRASRRVILQGAVAVLLASVLLLPWAVRNWVTFHQFIPLDAVGARNFYMGAITTRGYDSLNWNTNPKSQLLLEAETTPWKLYERGFQEIRNDPIGYLQASGSRMVRMWFSVYHPGLSSFYLGVVQAYLLAFYLLAAWGLWVSRGLWRKWLVLLFGILSFPFTLFPFWIEARYTTAARPIVLVFAAIGLLSLWEWLRKIRARHCSV